MATNGHHRTITKRTERQLWIVADNPPMPPRLRIYFWLRRLAVILFGLVICLGIVALIWGIVLWLLLTGIGA